MTKSLSDDALLASLADMPGVDVAHWKRAGGTDAGGYFYVAPGVLVAVPRPGYVQTAAEAQKSLEEFHRIARDNGRSHAAIVLVDRVTSQDASSRRVWAEANDHALRCSLALVCSSALSRAIGSFFIGLNRPQVPTKMFRDYASAQGWSEEMVRASWDDGRLES